MRIKYPDLTGYELLKHLVDNKTDLIAQKKSMPIFSESCLTHPTLLSSKDNSVQIKANEPITADVDELRVRVVANTANWLDSHMDMLIPNSAKRSIDNRKALIPHIHDHIHKIEAKIGKVHDILLSELSFAELGIKDFGSGSTQAIVFITDVMKELNMAVFNQYKNGQINQHSIGLQYVSLSLAINNSDFKEEFATWGEFFPQMINKEIAEKREFFWAIREIKLLENSAVLFGSNEITPTLDNNLKSIDSPFGTQDSGSQGSTRKRRRIY